MEFKDYYQTLGVAKAATEKEIKQAFRKLARKFHPDVNPGDKTAEAKFKEINEAYEVLGDADKRRKYERLGLIQPSRTIGSMRLYSRGELDRLKLIKRLVDDAGINLAGVQRLLSIAEVIQRLRPLMRDDALTTRDARRRVSQELDELSRMLGIE